MDVVYRDLVPLHEQGASPKAKHPPGYGALERRSRVRLGGLDVSVHSTVRRADGWTYNLATAAGGAVWLGYFHHLPTRKRVHHASSAGAEQLARALEVD